MKYAIWRLLFKNWFDNVMSFEDPKTLHLRSFEMNKETNLRGAKFSFWVDERYTRIRQIPLSPPQGPSRLGMCGVHVISSIVDEEVQVKKIPTRSKVDSLQLDSTILNLISPTGGM